MKQVNFRISDAELDHLKQFCELTERNQSDVVRQAIRRLWVKDKLEPIDTLSAIHPDAHL